MGLPVQLRGGFIVPPPARVRGGLKEGLPGELPVRLQEGPVWVRAGVQEGLQGGLPAAMPVQLQQRL